jgi:alpha-tubulin suppressor-like RCC1 family protein
MRFNFYHSLSPGFLVLALSFTAPLSFADLVPLSNVKQIDAGSGHTCALLNTGEIKCWGRKVV